MKKEEIKKEPQNIQTGNDKVVVVDSLDICDHDYIEINSFVKYMECSKCENVLV